jgi:hypothetical protein
VLTCSKATGSTVDENGNTIIHDLAWPGFNKSATMQRNWDAADPRGRIRVELAAGFMEQVDGRMAFTNLSTIVCFSFFPAPIGMSFSSCFSRKKL